MVRIALFALFLIIILVAVKFPKFRRSLGITVVVLMGAIGVIIWQDSIERDLELERIGIEQLQLSQMEVRSGLNARSFVISGRAHNLAKDYTTHSFQLQATIQDCTLGNCEIVGQEQVILPLQVPPAQSRDFSVTMPFSVVPEVKGKADWEYEVLSIRAR